MKSVIIVDSYHEFAVARAALSDKIVKLSKIAKLLNKGFEAFPKLLAISRNFRKYSKI